MFRRRPIRRPLRPLRGRRRPGAPKALIAANQLMEAGKYQQAAERFGAIAHAAEARNGPRAPQFYLQAGRARILAGQNETGLALVKQGLALLAQRGSWQRLHNAGNRAVAELNQRGLTQEAGEISEWLKNNLPQDFKPGSAGGLPKKHPVLPTHCPSCGAALRPDDVDWLDDVTAECAYCGSPVREEN